jgi:excisionase family DNA binding protein
MIERLAYSVDEVCAMLGVSVPTVYARINDGTLRSTKWGRRRLILRADVEALFHRAQEEQTQCILNLNK